MLPEKEKHLIFLCGLVSLIRIAITPAGEVILFQNQEQFGIGCIFVRIQIENTDKIAGDSGKNIPSIKGEIKNKMYSSFHRSSFHG